MRRRGLLPAVATTLGSRARGWRKGAAGEGAASTRRPEGAAAAGAEGTRPEPAPLRLWSARTRPSMRGAATATPREPWPAGLSAAEHHPQRAGVRRRELPSRFAHAVELLHRTGAAALVGVQPPQSEPHRSGERRRIMRVEANVERGCRDVERLDEVNEDLRGEIPQTNLSVCYGDRMLCVRVKTGEGNPLGGNRHRVSGSSRFHSIGAGGYTLGIFFPLLAFDSVEDMLIDKK